MNCPFPQAKLKILIIEDSQIVAERYMSLLNAQGDIEVVGVAHNASFALQLVELHKPDIALIDIHLETDPHAPSGITLLSLLRDRFPKVKAVMLTNLVEDVYRDKCLEIGASYFLDKSDDFEHVIKAVKNIALNKAGEF